MIKNFHLNNFSENSFDTSKIFKKTYLDYLKSANTNNSKIFFKKHTRNIDKFLFQIFSYVSSNFKNNRFISFIALGSYARVELCLHSDIDIMILYKNSHSYDISKIIERFVAFAWDCGLKLGLRVVRLDEIDELYGLAKDDVTIKTSLLESRHIFGSKRIYQNFEIFVKNLRQIEKRKFIEEQLYMHTQRLKKHPLDMQVNLKEGYGGIREANMLFWILNVVYDVQKAKELVGTKLNINSYKKFTNALDFIFQTRNTLHTIHKKKVDLISFDTLPELSKKLGFKNEFECMSKVFSSLHTIHNFHSNMSSKFVKSIFFDKENLKNLKEYRYKKGIYIIENRLFCSFNRKSVKLSSLLKELISFPQNINGFDRSYVYFASQTKRPKIISKNIKKDIKTLLCNENLYPILKLFYNSELISILLPNFKKILHLSQFDGYHRHPVDIHSLQALKLVTNIDDSFIKDIYDNLTKDEKILTRLVTLYHDIGKGRRKDHHIIGENIFKKAMKNFGFDDELIKTGANIIRYHDQMSRISMNEDIYSQKTILNFIGLFKNINEIKILYVLTYCDICAVNKYLFNSSTAELLKVLYKKSILAFQDPELIRASITRVSKLNRIKTLPNYQDLPNTLKRKISQISSNQMFLRLKSVDILDIAIKAKDVSTYSFDIINENYLKIRITRKIPLNLGYLLGKLQYLDMNGMNIFKLYDEKKIFEISFSKKALDEELYLIEEIINDSFDMNRDIKLKKPIIKRKDIKIDCNHSEYLASMKIHTKDQKGLFAYIAKVFDDFGIEIESSKLTTSKGYAKDLLLIEKNGNFCKNSEKILDLICS
ncbi:[protein-PII] uridylyltransferase family protein [Aliarcobacter vitoriensis]|uniref:Protein-PII uridylyltransferase n=2 Tax=Aliarcobacter TaxID=2321111 RepID=A0A366MV88_9BACT|nr:HD domain-containing protein [Aliarcobacter vitoriensis]RBQ30178.1 protein-PII uridylyltransferase [Aliarcobacter vitoriensis]